MSLIILLLLSVIALISVTGFAVVTRGEILGEQLGFLMIVLLGVVFICSFGIIAMYVVGIH